MRKKPCAGGCGLLTSAKGGQCRACRPRDDGPLTLVRALETVTGAPSAGHSNRPHAPAALKLAWLWQGRLYVFSVTGPGDLASAAAAAMPDGASPLLASLWLEAPVWCLCAGIVLSEDDTVGEWLERNADRVWARVEGAVAETMPALSGKQAPRKHRSGIAPAVRLGMVVGCRGRKVR